MRHKDSVKSVNFLKKLNSDIFCGNLLQDGNGTIENEELRGFLKDLLELVKKDYDSADLADFEDTIMKGYGISQKMIFLTVSPPLWMGEQGGEKIGFVSRKRGFFLFLCAFCPPYTLQVLLSVPGNRVMQC